MSLMRSRWAAIGAAVAVTLGGGGIALVSATSPADAVTFVPITPCRVLDTRPGLDTVGPRSTALGADETYTVDAVAGGDGAGECAGVIPAGATAVSMNVTTTDATGATFLTIWEAGIQRPLASSLNPVPGQPPTPNAVTTGVSGGGEFSIYNLAGSVNVLADINGYYADHHHDDRYYTKAQSDDRFTTQSDNDGRYYTQQQSDDRYQRATSGAEAAFTYEERYKQFGVGTAASVTVDTPERGYVIVNVSAQAQNDTFQGATGGLGCSLTDGTTMDDDQRINTQELEWTDYHLFAGTRAFEVTAVPVGGEQTYRLVCQTVVGDAELVDIHLNATFIPDDDARPSRAG